MRIGVFADSHGDISPARLFLPLLGQLDALFHLGDHAADAPKLGKLFDCPVYAVRGTCDFGAADPLELTVNLEGKRFLLLHGHQYYARESLLYRAEEVGADMLLYGHSHVPELSADGARLILNPGSLSRPRWGSQQSCALITIDEGQLKVKFINQSSLSRRQ